MTRKAKRLSAVFCTATGLIRLRCTLFWSSSPIPGERRDEARWRSGYAEDCKSLHAGSIPARASISASRDLHRRPGDMVLFLLKIQPHFDTRPQHCGVLVEHTLLCVQCVHSRLLKAP